MCVKKQIHDTILQVNKQSVYNVYKRIKYVNEKTCIIHENIQYMLINRSSIVHKSIPYMLIEKIVVILGNT